MTSSTLKNQKPAPRGFGALALEELKRIKMRKARMLEAAPEMFDLLEKIADSVPRDGYEAAVVAARRLVDQIEGGE